MDLPPIYLCLVFKKIQVLDGLVLPYCAQIHLARVLFDGNEVAATQDEVNSSILFAVGPRETRFRHTT
jgi:hypothetical protein